MRIRTLTGGSLVLLLTGPGLPADPPKERPATLAHMVALPDDLKWVDGPPGLPATTKVAVLDGDPSQPGGTFTIRAKVPDGWTVMPHWHSVDEKVTVIQGTLRIGMGESFDKAKLRDLPAGAFARMSKGQRHFAVAKGETILQIHGEGPFDIHYVNEADDPRKK